MSLYSRIILDWKTFIGFILILIGVLIFLFNGDIMKQDKKSFVRTGVFVSDKDFNKVKAIRDIVLSDMNLVDTNNYYHGLDYDGQIVRVYKDRVEKLDLCYENMGWVRDALDSIIMSYGFPKSTDDCVYGVQMNKEITITRK